MCRICEVESRASTFPSGKKALLEWSIIWLVDGICSIDQYSIVLTWALSVVLYLVLPSLLPLNSIQLSIKRLSRSAATEPILSCLTFFHSAQVSPVSHITSTTPVGFLALLRLPCALLNSAFVPVPVPTLPLLSTCPLHTNSGCGKERRILIGP